MTGLVSMDTAELEALLKEWGEPRFRAKQVFSWLSRGVKPENMTNLPKTLRSRLSELAFDWAEIYDKFISQKDGTIKYLFSLSDGNIVEGVLMRYHYGNTLCISTQVGCRMGCAFCASTLEGCIRNLTPGEMLSFVALANADVPAEEGRDRSVTNIVLMGSGEPLDNYDNTVKFLKLVSSPDGMGISPRNISLSSCGLVPRIDTLPQDAPHVTLSVSLHAPNDEIRNKLMPINKAYPIAEVLAAARRYAQTTGRRVVFEYALVKGLNDSQANANELAARLRGMTYHVNLIPLNPVKERNLLGTSRKEAEVFRKWLEDRGISATVRREMGTDIDGACGQLRRRVLMQREEQQ